MDAILEVKDLWKSFGDFSLKNINITLKKGYIMGLIGPNGAGKSTIIKLIMNLVKKDAGKIKIFGLDHIEGEVDIKERIGFVYDESHYYEELTTGEMKKLIAPFYKNWCEETFQKYMNDFNLSVKQRIKDLSKGMKMKYSVALALSHNAELIIMDEPTSGLDPIIRSELLDILYNIIQDENKSILFSTHITNDLDKIADYITFIHNGQLVFSSLKDEVLEQYRIVKGGKEILNEEIKKEFVGIKEYGYGFEGLIMDRKSLRQKLGDQVIYEKPKLEDIMVFTVRGRNHV